MNRIVIGYLNADKIKADGYVSPELRKYINWYLKIHVEEWFSEEGIKLNADEIISKGETIVWTDEAMKASRLIRSLIRINDFFFLENQMRPRGIPKELFSGKIDGIGRVKDGVLIEEKIKDSKKEKKENKKEVKARKFCSNCGSNIENKKFCSKCGEKTNN
jgi:hypothetical protein